MKTPGFPETSVNTDLLTVCHFPQDPSPQFDVSSLLPTVNLTENT